MSSLLSSEWLKPDGFATLPVMESSHHRRPDSNEAIGERLELLRRAYGVVQGYKREMSQSEFARQCEIGIQAWHNVESGNSRIGLNNAMRVRARTGASLDYIYFGNRTGLPHVIAVAIAEIEKTAKRA
jgi:transcriptional regulator with XRE-family HTH domain